MRSYGADQIIDPVLVKDAYNRAQLHTSGLNIVTNHIAISLFN